MRLFRVVVPLVLILLGVTACKQEQNFGGKNPTKVYGSVISLSPGTTEIIGNLALEGSVLVGRTQACNYPPHVTDVPVVCSDKPDYEKIAKIQPDLIVLDATLFSPAEIEKLKQVAPRADFRILDAKTVDQFIDFIYRLGSDLQSSSRFSEYADKVYAKSRVARTNPPEPKPKVAVLIGGGGEYWAAGTEGFLADTIRGGGGIPVGPKSVKFERVNVETLVAENPDVIMTGKDKDQIEKDPRLASISAIKSKSVYNFDPDILLREGTRVDMLLDKMNSVIAARSAEMRGEHP
jgi:iron complex transport system substrate-binding protein